MLSLNDSVKLRMALEFCSATRNLCCCEYSNAKHNTTHGLLSLRLDSSCYRANVFVVMSVVIIVAQLHRSPTESGSYDTLTRQHWADPERRERDWKRHAWLIIVNQHWLVLAPRIDIILIINDADDCTGRFMQKSLPLAQLQANSSQWCCVIALHCRAGTRTCRRRSTPVQSSHHTLKALQIGLSVNTINTNQTAIIFHSHSTSDVCERSHSRYFFVSSTAKRD